MCNGMILPCYCLRIISSNLFHKIYSEKALWQGGPDQEKNLFQVMFSNLVIKEEKIEFFEPIIVANEMFSSSVRGDEQLQLKEYAGAEMLSKQYLSRAELRIAMLQSWVHRSVPWKLQSKFETRLHIIQPHPTINLPRYLPVKLESANTSVCPSLDLAFYQVNLKFNIGMEIFVSR